MSDVVRAIPCLDVKDGRVVKGVRFVDLRDARDPGERLTKNLRCTPAFIHDRELSASGYGSPETGGTKVPEPAAGKDISDAELMARAGLGDRGAFAELVRRYQRPLLNFFRRVGARMDEAEDLVQETFLRVYAYRERYRPSGKFPNFLYVLARHAWADFARKGARGPKADMEALAGSAVPGGESRTDARLDVQEALEALSEKLRVVLVLSIYQGLKQEEIAEALEIPVGTVKSRMHLALKRMKELLDVGGEDQGH